MNINLGRFGFLAVMVASLAACGGSGSNPVPPPPPPPPGATLAETIAAAAADPANDSAVNPAAAFTVLQEADKPVVTVASPPKVNFTVFSDGKVVKGLTTTSNVRFVLAKLDPGTDGDPDQWVSYVYTTETATAGVGPGGNPVLASALQPTSDPRSEPQLVYNSDGYYTYTFSTDITDPTKTQGVIYEPGKTHRIGIQLSYLNAAGETVRVNPTFDFTLDASGNSVAVTDATKSHKVVDVSTCNECHNKLALHGGGRVDTQYCALCHNSGNTDANSGNVLDLRTMVHKIHAGGFLHEEGDDYVIWGFQNSEHSYTDVGFPANVRDCAKCHDGSKKDAQGNQLAAQGDNWKKVPSKQACLSCHESGATSDWYNIHITTLGLGTSVDNVTNAFCASCHGAGEQWSPDRVHWLQELENTALYQHKIESVTLTTKPTATTPGELTVKYSLINPATSAIYDLRQGCGAAGTALDDAGTAIPKCYTNYRWFTAPLSPTNQPQDKFGTIGATLAVDDFPTPSDQTEDDTNSTVSKAAYLGVDDGAHHYSFKIPVPKGSHSNARIVMLGSVAEQRIDPISRLAVGAVPPTTHEDLAYVPVKNAIYEINLDTAPVGTAAPPSNIARRQIVSNVKCNACHVYLGIPMDPVIGATAFHSGVRNNSENCEICHNWQRAASYTVMADGSDFNESYDVTRMVHGIHGGEKRTYPFVHGNDLQGEFAKDGTRIVPNDGAPLQSQSGTAAEVVNFTAEVAFPGRLADCNTCHVNEAWKQNRGVFGSSIVGTSGGVLNGKYTNPGIVRFMASGACVGPSGPITDPPTAISCASIDTSKLPVISPKAAVCTACHDAKGVQDHAINVGGASFGNKNQGDVLASRVFEVCDGCHEPGGFAGIDIKHGLN